MSKGVVEVIAGAAELAGGIAIEVFFPGNPWGIALIAAGASTVTGGIGTLLTKQQVGLGANVRSPIAPWNVIYGQAKVGGTVVYIEETGESDKYLHMIYVLACHPCHSVDAVLFDGKRVILSENANIWDSETPSQWSSGISRIVRSKGLVTVTLNAPFVGLFPGDTIAITNVGADQTLNGQYQVNPIGTNGTQFQYTCGGNDVSISGQGTATTTWPDYGDTIHAEIALGTQGPGNPPFPGLLAGGDTGSQGLWTANHLLQGRTAIYLRLKYGGNTYQSGLPAISFLVSGKNDIYDPRTGTNYYTPNAALCIADFLTNKTWGLRCNYGTDVPTAPLQAAANICDESVALANGQNEPRYTSNGSFQLNAKRGEILENLLTSCAGRLSYAAGQFILYPGAWIGPGYWLGVGPTTATLSVISSYTGDGPDVRFSTQGPFFPDPDGNVFNQAWFQSSSGYPRQLSSTTLASGQSLADLVLYVELWNTLFWTGNAQLNIYDVYVTAVDSDGNVSTLRPTNYTILPGDGSGTVANPANAYDGDPNSFATVVRTSTSSLSPGPVLELSGWSNPPPPSPDAPIIPSIAPLQYAAAPFQWKPELSVRDLYNGVKATYVSPLNSWQAADMPPYAQDTDHGYAAPSGVTGYYDVNLAADNNERRWYDMQLPFTISVSMAQRIAKIELLRRRMQGMGTFVFNLSMIQLTALDIVAFNLPLFHWSNKLLEVTAHRFTVTKKEENALTLGTELDLQETDPSIYSWSTSEELTPEGYRQAQTNNVASVQTPAGVTLANSAVNGSGISTGQVQVTWTAPTDGYVANGGQTIVQYSLDDTHWTGLGTYDPSVTTALVPNVAAGQQYWVRIAYINAAGIQGAWTVEGPLTATGSSLNYYTTSWSSQTSLTVTHNLNSTNVLVQVRDANNVIVQPESITITSANVVTLTFGSAFSGSVLVLAL